MAAKKTGYRATAKWLIASPSKVRPVADLVRMKSYPQAIAILENVPNKGAKLIEKVVVSAVSNALNQNKKLDESMPWLEVDPDSMAGKFNSIPHRQDITDMVDIREQLVVELYSK